MRESHVLRLTLLSFFALAWPVFGQVQTFELLPVNATWKYRDDGVDLYTAGDWIENSYDDSGWASGPAELGFDSSPGSETTTLTKGSVTFYFRTTFNVTQQQLDVLEADDNFYQLVVNLLRDDGAVVYINGFELMRSSMDAGSVGHNTFANTNAVGSAESTFMEYVRDGTNYLQAGQNVIAVSIHQFSPGNSDISFNMSLSASKQPSQYGRFSPPQKIDFDEADQAGSALSFEPDPNKGHTDLGWFTTPGNNPAAYGTANRDPVDDTMPVFQEGYAFIVNFGRASLVTQNTDQFGNVLKYRIDLRNYVDVKVSFDVRCYDFNYNGVFPTNGFDSADYFRFYNLTSQDGTDYTRTLAKELRGGGSGGGGTNATPLIREGDAKKILIPTNGNLGTSWIQPGFNDASWTSFSGGGAGYDTGTRYNPFIAYNTRTPMYGRNTSCYVRIPFQVTDKDAFDGLVLYTRDDDGFVAYLNGFEVASWNKPGGLTWNSAASGDHPDDTAEVLKPRDISAHLNRLVNGTNVLAIHGLNSGPTSSDFLTSATLEGTETGEPMRNDPPQFLDDVNFGPDGGFYRHQIDIPNEVQSYTFEVEMNANEFNETILFDNFSISGTPLTVDGYDAWVLLETNLVSDESGHPLADPDCDGIINYLEFAFGSDPEVASRTSAAGTSLLPRVRVVEESGQFYFEMTWRQLDAVTSGDLDFPFGGFSVYDIKYIPQFSTDGVTWEDAESQYQGDQVGEFVENGDGTFDVTMRYKSPIAVSGGDPALLGRIKVRKTLPFIQ